MSLVLIAVQLVLFVSILFVLGLMSKNMRGGGNPKKRTPAYLYEEPEYEDFDDEEEHTAFEASYDMGYEEEEMSPEALSAARRIREQQEYATELARSSVASQQMETYQTPPEPVTPALQPQTMPIPATTEPITPKNFTPAEMPVQPVYTPPAPPSLTTPSMTPGTQPMSPAVPAAFARPPAEPASTPEPSRRQPKPLYEPQAQGVLFDDDDDDSAPFRVKF